MATSRTTRRKKARSSAATQRIARLRLDDGRGGSRWITAELVDFSPGGVGLATAAPLAVGTVVNVNGKLSPGDERTVCDARVEWCLEKHDGSFRVGLQFEQTHEGKEWRRSEPAPAQEETQEDYYEVLQLSAKASPDTIHRVYRLLAQRFHPDNAETGDEETFKRVLSAYRVLSNPEARAAYDAKRFTRRKVRWRIFENSDQAQGAAGEKRKRSGILSLLYNQRLNEPESPQLTIHELEDLLGCPRDHLQVSLWYLKEKRLLHRDDRGRCEITVNGVDWVESLEERNTEAVGLLPAPRSVRAAGS